MIRAETGPDRLEIEMGEIRQNSFIKQSSNTFKPASTYIRGDGACIADREIAAHLRSSKRSPVG